MNSATGTTDIRSTLASVAKTFEPRRARFRNLVPFKDEIRELRSRGAAFVTIAEILKKHSVKASHETVRRFYREAIEQKSSRRTRSRNGSKRPQPAQPQPIQTNKGDSPQSAGAKKDRGPRIARIEDL